MAEINPKVLVWARETAGLTVAQAGKLLSLGGKKTSAENALLAYEQGEKAASRPLLLKMAAVYRRPLLIFYLPAPPARAERGEDFRTVPEEIRVESQGSLDALVRDIYVRRDLIRNLLIDIEEADPKGYVNSIDLDSDPYVVSERIAKLLNFDLDAFRRYQKPEDAFSYLRKCAESVGFFVLLMGNLGSHHSNIPVEAFRGFALADDVVPLIVINDQDAPSARSFTLLHELTHIMLGATGLSGSRVEQAVERFCNDVAGHSLLRKGELERTAWSVDDFETLALEITTYGQARNVSGSMVAYRLFLNATITQETWIRLSEKFRLMWLSTKAAMKARSSDGTGPSYYVVKRHRVGNALVELVGRTVKEGALTVTKAGKLLGVKPANVYNLVGA